MNRVVDLAQTGALSGPPIFHILGVVLHQSCNLKRYFHPFPNILKGILLFLEGKHGGGVGWSAVKTRSIVNHQHFKMFHSSQCLWEYFNMNETLEFGIWEIVQGGTKAAPSSE